MATHTAGSIGAQARRWIGPPGTAAARILIDSILIVGAAAWAWFASFGQVRHPGSPLPFVLCVVGARLPIYFALRLHCTCWRNVSKQDALWLAASAALGPPAIALLLYALPEPFTLRALVRPYLILATEPALYLILLSGVRLGARAIATNRRNGQPSCRILVLGAGDTARSLVWQIQEAPTRYQVVGFLDDDSLKHNQRVLGLPVLGSIDDAVALAPRLGVHQLVIAIPSLPAQRLRQILVMCEPLGIPVRLLPPLQRLMGEDGGVSTLREIQMEDLLPRPQVELERESIAAYVAGKTVLVTGGGGSIGGELCRQVLRIGAARLLVLGRGENSVFEMVQELSSLNGRCEVVPVICDVQDRHALSHVFEVYRPDVVFHAAAHKHVPLMEQYPAEAVKNNVLATLNVVDLSVRYRVPRFVLVSTDKAVDPSSVMGSTKRVSEMIVKAYASAKGASMVSVRFGNVLGSRGSVIPSMRRQIQNGQPVTVTDLEMVRYFMTVSEAAQLILQAGAIGGRGEVFVMDMGQPVRIMDLAQDLIRLCGLVPHRDVEIEIVGRRLGEKLNEDLLSRMEAIGARRNGQFYIAPAEPVRLSVLLSQINHLRVAAAVDDKAQILRVLRTIVPEYRPSAAHALTAGTSGRARVPVGGRT